MKTDEQIRDAAQKLAPEDFAKLGDIVATRGPGISSLCMWGGPTVCLWCPNMTRFDALKAKRATDLARTDTFLVGEDFPLSGYVFTVFVGAMNELKEARSKLAEVIAILDAILDKEPRSALKSKYGEVKISQSRQVTPISFYVVETDPDKTAEFGVGPTTYTFDVDVFWDEAAGDLELAARSLLSFLSRLSRQRPKRRMTSSPSSRRPYATATMKPRTPRSQKVSRKSSDEEASLSRRLV